MKIIISEMMDDIERMWTDDIFRYKENFGLLDYDMARLINRIRDIMRRVVLLDDAY